jgi:hypothetical protein
VLPKEGATVPSPFPFEMRNAATTYASSISTNMSAYEDLPGHHLLSIRNLIASSPDDSYSDTTNDINFFMDNLAAPEWDYSGVCDLDAFRSFQFAANYCLTCFEDSSEGDYDPTRECFMVELRTDRSTTLRTMTGTAGQTRRQTKRWCLQRTLLLRQAPRRGRHSWRNSRSFKPGSTSSAGRRKSCALRSSSSTPHVERRPGRRGASPGNGS